MKKSYRKSFSKFFLLLVFSFIKMEAFAQPVITSLSPTSGIVGSTVLINGSNFSPGITSNVVYFGAVKATVASASTTLLTVTVPAGATPTTPVTVIINGGLQASSITSATPFFTVTNTPALTVNATAYTQLNYSPGGNAAGLAVGDFNRDGFPDIASTSQTDGKLVIFLGDGNGGFTNHYSSITGSNPYAIVSADFDGDKILDLAVTHYSAGNTVRLFLGTGSGAFYQEGSYTVQNYAHFIKAGDLNGDGRMDLVVGSEATSNNISVLIRNTANNGFLGVQFITVTDKAMGVALADFNGDAKLDIAATSYNSRQFSISLRNTGNTGFDAPVYYTVNAAQYAYNIEVADFNNDLKADVIVGSIWEYNATVFTRNASPIGAGTGFDAPVSITLNSYPRGVGAADMDGDGNTDALIGNYPTSGGRASITLGNGAGGFSTPVYFNAAGGSNTAIAADFNGDGKADFVTNNSSGGASFSVFIYGQIVLKTEAYTATSVSKTGFTANWKAAGGATSYLLDVSTDPTFATFLPGYNDLTVTATSRTVGGLTPNTAYYYRVRSVNGSVTSPYSNTKMTFTGLPPGSGNALALNGVNQNVTIGTGVDFNYTGLFTIEAWAKLDAGATGYNVIFAKRSSTIYDGYSFGLNVDGGGNVRMIFEAGSSSVGSLLLGFQYNEWHHFVVIYGGGGFSLYMDGISYSTGSLSIVGNVTAAPTIGSYSDGVSFFKGTIDEVRIWNNIRTLAELQANMCKKLAGTETNLTGYYRFDEATGTTSENKAANSTMDATVNNNPVWSYSGAPLGDVSAYTYSSATSLTLNSGDSFTISNFNLSNTGGGMHIYKVNESPSQSLVGSGVDSLQKSRYFGVFPVVTTDYAASYTYTTNTNLNGKAYENTVTLAARTDNTVSTWNKINNTILDATNNVVKSPASPLISGRREFLAAFGTPPPPTVSTAATEVSKTSFRAHWTNTGSGSYDLDVSTVPTFITSLAGFPKTGVTDTFYIVSGLSANTVYYYRTRNSAGTFSNVKMTSTNLPPGSGNALLLDGVSQYIDLGSGYADFSKGLTLSLWTRPDAATESFSRFFDLGTGTNNSIVFNTQAAGTGNIMFRFRIGSIDQFTLNATSVLQYDTWQHVAVTMDATLKAIIYINGVAVASGVAPKLPSIVSRANNYIGKSNYGDPNYSGRIDEATIWNRGLSQTEIRAMMCQKLTGAENGLIAYFRMDENSGKKIENKAKGQTQDADLLGSPTWAISGAALGDIASNVYDAGTSLVNGNINAKGFTLAANQGVQIYRVNEAPNNVSLPAGINNFETSSYFGTFYTGDVLGIDITYDYSANPAINGTLNEPFAQLVSRTDNSSGQFSTIENATINTTVNIVAKSGVPRKEMMIGFTTPVAEYNVIGKSLVEEHTEEGYYISPAPPGTSYSWSYTGTGIIFATADTVHKSVSIYFKEIATNGTLRCRVYDSLTATYKIVTIDITVNHPGIAMLPPVHCDTIGTVLNGCSGAYINAFQLQDIRNTNSGCIPSGYEDYTTSAITTKLYIGEAYNAIVTLKNNTGNSGRKYVGIWLDYNNNGSFEEANEFLVTTFTDDSVFQINDLVIHEADISLKQERRLRIRVSTTGLFGEEQSCLELNETGETEDYTVMLVKSDLLEAPVLITPNNDGLNDLFIIKGIYTKEDKTANKLTILDKTGNVLFAKTHYTNLEAWDGKGSDGNLLQTGTYYYHFVNGDGNMIRGYFEIRY